jgi:hypothetical protein
MENVVILWSVGSAVAMVLAILCGLMWLIDRRDVSSLMLACSVLQPPWRLMPNSAS